jgi:5-methylcytosine-specific restriction endonuclease McrA
MAYGPGRTGSRWRTARTQCLTKGEHNLTPCYLCGQPINYTLSHTNPRHRLAPTAHHITALAHGGDPTDPNNLAPAHFGCNSADGNRMRRRHHHTKRVITSRRW